MNNSWDDIRFVIAVAETGSLNAAASRLGVTHATVLRRVAAFEARSGRKIFERAQSGYSLLPEAEPIVRAARNVEEAVLSVGHAIVGTDQTPKGIVRIASTDSLCLSVLPALTRQISTSYAELRLTLLCANTRHDFVRMSSDIAVRPSLKLSEELVGEQAGHLEFAAYHSDDGAPGWIGADGPITNSPAATWMDNAITKDQIVQRADSFVVMREMAAAGIGRAILPRIIADDDPRLIRVDGEISPIMVPVWVAMLPDLVANTRFRTVQSSLLDGLSRVLPRYCQ